MKKLASLLALMACFAGSANAQGGMSIGVNDCWTWEKNNRYVYNACQSNDGTAFTLHVEITPPIEMRLVTAECVIDVTYPHRPIDPNEGTAWWQLGGSGYCRDGAVKVSAIAGGESCKDIWDQSACGLLVYRPYDSAFWGRHRLISISGCPEAPVPITPAHGNVAVNRVTISRKKTVGVGSCEGCEKYAEITLNSVKLTYHKGGRDYGEVIVSESSGNRWVEYLGTAVVPTSGRTWGAIKALYR